MTGSTWESQRVQKTPCKIRMIQSKGRRLQIQAPLWMLHSDWLQGHTTVSMCSINLLPSPPSISQTSMHLAGLCAGSEWCECYATTVKSNLNKLPLWITQCYSVIFYYYGQWGNYISFGIYVIDCSLRWDITVDGLLLCSLMAAPLFQSACTLSDSCKWT